MEPTPADLRASYLAQRRVRPTRRRPTALLGRLLELPVSDGDGWYSRVQLLTDAGELERASTLLAEVARGEHPDALDPARVRAASPRFGWHGPGRASSGRRQEVRAGTGPRRAT